MKTNYKNKIVSLLLGLGSLMSVAYAGNIKVGATPVPAAEILEFAKPLLAKQGVNMTVQSFTDYITPDIALNDKTLDATMHQHKPFLDKINKDRKLNLISIAQIHIEPIGGYSTKIKSINALPNGATIAIPSDATNGGRALILLHNNGLITLKNPNNLNATEFDIIQNPKNLKIKPIEAALLTKTLQDVDLAIINGNYAMQIRLKTKDALILEDSRSPYVNILAVRLGDENKAEIIKLKNALQSQEVKQFIQDTYKGEVIPAF